MNSLYTQFSVWVLKNLNWLYPILAALLLIWSFVLLRSYFDNEKEVFQGLTTISFFLLGGYFTLLSYKINHDKLFKELFISFNQRFDRMNEKLNNIAEKGQDQQLKPKETNRIIDYINLCAEEYMWYKKGRIDQAVWNAWKAGIEYYLKNHHFKKVFNEEKKQSNSYYGFFKEFKNHYCPIKL